MSHHGRASIALLILFASVAFAVRAEELRPAMERVNAKFLAAFNRPNPAGFAALYTPDAVLLFSGLPPKTGPKAITHLCESRIEHGVGDGRVGDRLVAVIDGQLAGYDLSSRDCADRRRSPTDRALALASAWRAPRRRGSRARRGRDPEQPFMAVIPAGERQSSRWRTD